MKANKVAHVTVIARVRPLLPSEVGEQVEHQPGSTISLTVRSNAASANGAQKTAEKEHKYAFARVHVGDDNRAVYAQSVAPFVAQMKAGRSCACFAYGYTGTGKSVTIYGSKHAGDGNTVGVAELAAHELLGYVAELGPDYSLRVSMCEVAGKDCRDLLDNNAPLKIRMAKDGSVHVRKEDGGERPRAAACRPSEHRTR